MVVFVISQLAANYARPDPLAQATVPALASELFDRQAREPFTPLKLTPLQSLVAFRYMATAPKDPKTHHFLAHSTVLKAVSNFRRILFVLLRESFRENPSDGDVVFDRLAKCCSVLEKAKIEQAYINRSQRLDKCPALGQFLEPAAWRSLSSRAENELSLVRRLLEENPITRGVFGNDAPWRELFTIRASGNLGDEGGISGGGRAWPATRAEGPSQLNSAEWAAWCQCLPSGLANRRDLLQRYVNVLFSLLFCESPPVREWQQATVKLSLVSLERNAAEHSTCVVIKVLKFKVARNLPLTIRVREQHLEAVLFGFACAAAVAWLDGDRLADGDLELFRGSVKKSRLTVLRSFVDKEPPLTFTDLRQMAGDALLKAVNESPKAAYDAVPLRDVDLRTSDGDYALRITGLQAAVKGAINASDHTTGTFAVSYTFSYRTFAEEFVAEHIRAGQLLWQRLVLTPPELRQPTRLECLHNNAAGESTLLT